MSIKLLDCTLRDGGFLNNWKFGKSDILTIYNRLNKANIDIIEVGFIDDSYTKDSNATINPTSKFFDELFSVIKNKKAMTVAMIDYGTCNINNISCPDFLDGIRVIFKKKDIDGALNYCKQLKDKGYKVFVQPVSITTYSDKEMLDLIEKVNKLKPYAMSIVDTYGLMHKDNLIKYFYLIDNNLDENISLGYHSHNNFQLGYANSIEFIEMKTKRNLIVDGSLFGMGKSAGNTSIELLAMYMNENYSKNYDVDEILELIDLNIMKYKHQHDWGYSMPYYVSALNDCHPKYVQYLKDKNTLSIKSINNILERIEHSKKLTFNKDYIEQLYIEYQQKDFDDSLDVKNLEKNLSSKNILLLGPGRSVLKQKNKVLEYIATVKPVIISINHIPSICEADYLFISNNKRYEHYVDILINKQNKFKIIATSNISPIYDEFDFVLNYGKLLNKNEIIGDNSMSMLLTAFKNMKIKKLALAGFDGFNIKENNYYDSFLSFAENNKDVDLFNEAIAKQLIEFRQFMEIDFITESTYEQKKVKYAKN